MATKTAAQRQRSREGKIAAQRARAVAYYRKKGDEEKAQEYERLLRLTGRCIRCGRELWDKASVADSIGPECKKVVAA